MKIRTTRYFIVLLVLVVNLSYSQVEFRIPFSCEYIKEIEHKEFETLLKTRYVDQLNVYSYLEQVGNRYALCRDSITYFHIQYALIFRDFLLSKNTIKRAANMYHKSANYPEVSFLFLNEFLYQCAFNGKLTAVDSCAGSMPWDKFPPPVRSQVARNIYFLMNHVLEGGELRLIKNRIDPNDTLLAVYTEGWKNPKIGDVIKELYHSGRVIEANAILENSISSIRKQEEFDRATKELTDVKHIVESFGFKIDQLALRKIYDINSLSKERDEDYFTDYVKYIFHRNEIVYSGDNQMGEKIVYSIWAMAFAIVLLLASVVYFIWIRVKNRRLEKEYILAIKVRLTACAVLWACIVEEANRITAFDEKTKKT